MNLGPLLALGISCLASTAHADGPSLEGRLELGLRTSSTSESHYGIVGDETSSVRGAVDGTVGVRWDRFVIGAHAGIAQPLHFFASELADSGEQVPYADSTIYPLDLGVGGEVDLAKGVWLSAWVGTTVAFTHASSPAAFLNNIDYYGQVPDASWRYRTTGLGYGGAVGYDFTRTQYGRVAGVVELESQNIGPIATRNDRGGTGMDTEALTCTSLTFGVAYAY